MDDILTSIIQEIQDLLQTTKTYQNKILNEILALEKILNTHQKTTPLIRKKEKDHKQPQVPQITPQTVSNKVDALLDQIETIQKNIHLDPRPKIEVKPVEVPVEKKPPIPTVNRAEKTVKSHIPSYVAPRNKNEVTGKVTQTTIRTSTQKVFKPQLTGIKRSSSRQMVNRGGNPKNKQSVEEKVETVPSKKVENIPEKKIEQPVSIKQTKKISPPPIAAKVIEERPKQNQHFKLEAFQKNFEEIIEQFSSKGNHNRKAILQKMIRDCENQAVGYKKQEQSSRMSFIKKAYSYGLSRNAVHPVITHKIERQKWMFYEELFQYEHMIVQLSQEARNLGDGREYRVDPRQQYRIWYTAYKMSQILTKIEEDQANVPEQLKLSFNFNKNLSAVIEDDNYQIDDMELSKKLGELLDYIEECGNIKKQELKAIQMLAEVGMFKSKKCPMIVPENEFQEWRDQYFDFNK